MCQLPHESFFFFIFLKCFFCSSKTPRSFLPQGLCTSCSLCLDHPLPDIHMPSPSLPPGVPSHVFPLPPPGSLHTTITIYNHHSPHHCFIFSIALTTLGYNQEYLLVVCLLSCLAAPPTCQFHPNISSTRMLPNNFIPSRLLYP